MTEAPVNRSYHSPRRDQAALATRAAILDAAEALYVERGYAVTRLADIASAARVSPATVKNAFQTKRGLLEALIRARVVGDADATPLGERDAWAQILAERDPRRLVEAFVAFSAELHARSAGLIEVVVHGASADAELAELARRGAENRLRDLGEVISALRALGALRDGLDARHATDMLWALTSPLAYRQLVAERGWSSQRWAAFTSDAVVATLLSET